MKFNYKLLSTLFFFLTTPMMIVLSLNTLVSLQNTNGQAEVLGKSTEQAPIYAALPDESPTMSIKLIASDARGDILKKYLNEYGSPLEPYAFYTVNIADEYNVDFRLVTAIAQQESNLCKFIPDNTYNCWGWGIHSRGTLGFTSYEEGISAVTQGLRNDYLSKGYNTPDEIMKKYTPLSNGSWAEGVKQFMSEME